MKMMTKKGRENEKILIKTIVNKKENDNKH